MPTHTNSSKAPTSSPLRYQTKLSHMELLDQFPQPTRPAYFSEMTSMSQLPQPSNPTNIYNMTSVSSTPQDQHRYPHQDLESTQHIQASKTMHNHSRREGEEEEEETVDELVQILVECLDQVNTKNREFLLRKFFSELEKETPLEKFIVERLKQSKVKAISVLIEKHPECLQEGQVNSEENSMQRDLDVVERHNFRELVEVLSPKLERFKVRTVYQGEVVTVEKK